MIPISPRFALPLLLLAGLALVPVVRHSYVGRTVEDCADPEAMFDTRAIEGVATSHEVQMQHVGLRFQFTRGKIVRSERGSPRLVYHILRTFDPKNLYMQPVRSVRKGFETDRQEFEWIDANGASIPVHWRIGHEGREDRVVGYFYVYESRPVESPFWRQLATAFDQVLHGTRPLTLVQVTGVPVGGIAETVQAPAREWLVAAWSYYSEVCAR